MSLYYIKFFATIHFGKVDISKNKKLKLDMGKYILFAQLLYIK